VDLGQAGLLVSPLESGGVVTLIGGDILPELESGVSCPDA